MSTANCNQNPGVSEDTLLEEWKVKHKNFYEATLGNKGATKKVIEDFMDMVYLLAHRYENMCPGFLYDDLVQEGVLGVLQAIETFSTDKRTSGGSPISPSTWIWWKVRGSVQSAARKFQSMYKISTFSGAKIVEDCHVYKDTDCPIYLDVEEILKGGCGSLDSRRAKIIKDRFGLMGAKPMKQGDVAKKYGISKQATHSHLIRFFNVIRDKYPELKGVLQ